MKLNLLPIIIDEFFYKTWYTTKNGGSYMSTIPFEQLSAQVDMLSYTERIRLLNKIVQTLHTPIKIHKREAPDFDAAFGLWKDRDISVQEIRTKAWRHHQN